MEKTVRERSKAPQKHPAKAALAQTKKALAKEQAGRTPQRRAGDVEQAWQRAKLEPSMWPFPAPIHGKAGLTWAVLPTGETVKWTDLGMDRRLEHRLKSWLGEGKKASR